MANLVIAAFVATLILTPLSYYTIRGDRYDERWAWRMFSPERMVSCSTVFATGEPSKRVSLPHTFHKTWIKLAERGRRSVIDAMAEKLCADHPGEPVRLRLSCKMIDGQTEILDDATTDLCASGKP